MINNFRLANFLLLWNEADRCERKLNTECKNHESSCIIIFGFFTFIKLVEWLAELTFDLCKGFKCKKIFNFFDDTWNIIPRAYTKIFLRSIRKCGSPDEQIIWKSFCFTAVIIVQNAFRPLQSYFGLQAFWRLFYKLVYLINMQKLMSDSLMILNNE